MEATEEDVQKRIELIELRIGHLEAIEQRLGNLEKIQGTQNEAVVEVSTKVDGLITNFERRIEMLEVNYEHYGKTLGDVDEKVDKLHGKVDNEFSKLIDSNRDIVKTVLRGNQKADERDDAFKTKKWGDWVQLSMTLLSSGGLIYFVVQYFINR